MTALNLWPLLCGLWKKIVFHVLKEVGLTHIEEAGCKDSQIWELNPISGRWVQRHGVRALLQSRSSYPM